MGLAGHYIEGPAAMVPVAEVKASLKTVMNTRLLPVSIWSTYYEVVNFACEH